MNDQPNQDQADTQPPPHAQRVIIDENLSSETKTMAMLSHLLGIFTGFIGALIIWLVKKDTDPFVEDQAKEALNFQITVLIASFIAGAAAIATCLVLIPLPIAVGIAALVFCIIGAVKSYEGERYRYPICWRLIK